MDGDYLFVSYFRRDSAAFVERLVSDLRAAGISVWLDMAEIRPGTSWVEAITDAIGGAKVFLCVISDSSAQSEYLRRELEFALSRRVQVIPVLTGGKVEGAFELHLSNLQYLDFRTDYRAAFASLLDAVRKVIIPGPPTLPKPQRSKGYVFISYTDTDEDFVTQLRSYLAERGYSFWDYESSDRDYHTQLFRELEGIIRESVATLSVLSEAWKESRWTIREYFFSEEVGIPVFLLRAKPISPTLAIAGVPYIDFVADTQRGFEKLDRELKRKGL